jgi:hypothetical protein
MSSIDNLKAAISSGKGLARNNKFSVSIGKQSSNEFSGVDGIILAETVTLPGRTIATSDFASNRQSLKAAYTFIDDPVSMTFLLTNDYKIKRFFDAWMTLIFDAKKYTIGYKADYTSSIEISQLDNKNLPIYTVELENAYPIVQSSYDLSNATENDITRLTVTFSYDKYNVKN